MLGELNLKFVNLLQKYDEYLLQVHQKTMSTIGSVTDVVVPRKLRIY